MREVEAGHSFTVTVQGRDVARLMPAVGGTWRKFDEIASVFELPADEDLLEDLAQLGGGLSDAWQEESPPWIW